MSPPVSSSTPLGTPEITDSRIGKPALPPKPAVPVKPTPPPPPRQGQPQDHPENKGYIEITAESLDQALSLNKGNINVNTLVGGSDGGSNKVSSDEVPFESDRSRTPTPPPPPPPTTEPPDDISLRRIENIENISKDDKVDVNDSKLKSNQSSNLVNCNHSGTQINNISSIDNGNNNNHNNNFSNSSSNNSNSLQNSINISKNNNNNDNIINKNNLSESNNGINNNNNNIHVSINRRIEMPPAFMFPENEEPPADLIQTMQSEGCDVSKYSKPGETNLYTKNSEADLKNIDELDRIIPNDNDCFISSKIEENDKKSDIEDVETLNSINAQETQNNSGK